MRQRARGYLSRIAQPQLAGEGALTPHPSPREPMTPVSSLIPVIEDRIVEAESVQALPSLAFLSSAVKEPEAKSTTRRALSARTNERTHQPGSAGTEAALAAPRRTAVPVRDETRTSVSIQSKQTESTPKRIARIRATFAAESSAAEPSIELLRKNDSRDEAQPFAEPGRLSGRSASILTVGDASKEQSAEPRVKAAEPNTSATAHPAAIAEESSSAPIVRKAATPSRETALQADASKKAADLALKPALTSIRSTEPAEAEQRNESTGPRVSIGTLEIRAVIAPQPAPPPAPVPVPAAAQRSTAKPAEAAPLARGLGWSFGLVQG
jgi:hypothetical protein